MSAGRTPRPGAAPRGRSSQPRPASPGRPDSKSRNILFYIVLHGYAHPAARARNSRLAPVSMARFAAREPCRRNEEFRARPPRRRRRTAAPALAAKGADLIVLTTHGRGGLGRVVLGSVADKVVRGAASPVLLYRPRGH